METFKESEPPGCDHCHLMPIFIIKYLVHHFFLELGAKPNEKSQLDVKAENGI